MARYVLLHNPRCSKCREARAILEERGIDVTERQYLKQPLSLKELEVLRKKLGTSPSTWVRTGEPAYKEAGLSRTSSDAEILAAMAAHPILIERPILIADDRAVVGRPPVRILEILEA